MEKKAVEIAENWLDNITKITDMVINGEVNVF